MRKSDIITIIFLLTVLLGIGILYVALDSNVDLPATSLQDSTAVGGERQYSQNGPRGYGNNSYRGNGGYSGGQRNPYYSSYGNGGAVAGQNGQRFYFDPNTADSTQLQALGLPAWMVRGIYKYRAKGGIYRTPEDFARVPGLTQTQYKQLLPYITISNDYRPASELVAQQKPTDNQEIASLPPRDTIQHPYKLRPGQYIDINTADTTQLKKIPGIGSYYAKLIAEYRTRLGGFLSMDQLKEIQGLPANVVQSAADYINLGNSVQKIAINKLSLQQLRQHPYIGYYRAKAITDYRRLKGPITSLEQLGLLPNFTKEDIARLEPYVIY